MFWAKQPVMSNMTFFIGGRVLVVLCPCRLETKLQISWNVQMRRSHNQRRQPFKWLSIVEQPAILLRYVSAQEGSKSRFVKSGSKRK
jgi:hypothetical protein